MPQAINCDSGDGAPAEFLVSNLTSGETRSYCGSCLVGFGLTLALEALGPEGVLQAVGPVHVAKSKPSREGGSAKRARKSPAPEPVAQDPAQSAAEGEPEAAPAADSG